MHLDISDEDEIEIIVCAGPPFCSMEGNEAIDCQRAGCIWCKRILIDSDGRETVTEPGRA